MQLEAMVGDLEDAVLSVVNQRARNALMDHESRQEMFFQAVRFMNDIEEILASPVKFQPHWYHLLKSVDSRVDNILTLLRPLVLADHRAVLSSLGWPPKVWTAETQNRKTSILPNPLVLMQVDRQKAYSKSFLALCALQHVQKHREERQLGLVGQKEKLTIGLWAIDELVSPIASRMEYHILKWTDQPEFMFALVYKITRDFIVGVDDVLQPLIDKTRLVSFSAKESWVSAMVQSISAFLTKRVFSVLSERYREKETRLEVITSWLHLVDLMVSFDKKMLSLLSSEHYLFMGDAERLEGSSRYLSVFSVFSDRPDWLKIWGKIEIKEGTVKLKAELKHERAWLFEIKEEASSAIDRTNKQFLLYTREDHKAPLIVESALKLAWEMIDRGKNLPDILSRIQFIRSTATKLLWYFFNSLLLQYKRTECLAHDCSNDSLLTRYGVINAARYCEYKLQEWSDDVNFLEMKIAESEYNACVKGDGDDNRRFFGEEIKCLADLQVNCLMEIIAGILYQFETLTQEYIQNKEQFKQEKEDASGFGASMCMNFPVSDDFLEALDSLRSQLCIIHANLNPLDFSDLWRSVVDGLDRFVFSSMFMNGYRLSQRGIDQLRADMQALFLVFKPFCARPEAFFPRVRNALKLLDMNRKDLRQLQVVVSSNVLDRTDCVRSFGIMHLSFDQAEKILSSRDLGLHL
ncbi:RINT1-like protein MAG2L isoform X2 [Diospyros lotus]|uniref:RINT1-like protein MAG2L isoform X2 n=1 Tax=Diospyros lotus TaxID=55363 RepID=UPI002252A2F6|nr:RINT1-like protein MAG2L isoform X2 [Diospyros lotus]